MKLPWWWVALIGLASLGVAVDALQAHDAEVRRTALVQHSLDSTATVLDSLRARDAKLAQATHTDTLKLVQWRTRYDTVEKRVVLNVHDTVAVVQFVHAADSTIAACSQLVTDCQARTRLLTEQVVAVSAERDLWKRQAPNLIQRHVGLVSGAAGVVGLVAGVVLGKHF